MADAPGWAYLVQGKVLKAVLEPFLQLMGDYFYAAIILGTMMVIYMKNEDILSVTVTGSLLSGFIVAFAPGSTQFIFVLAVVFGVAAALYKAFW